MQIDLAAFHFLRPAWLLLILLAAALPALWLRAQDPARNISIPPALLRHLLVEPQDSARLRPVHLLAALLALGAIAAAGPTWEQDRPAFLDDRAPLILALDLSPSMDAADVPPSRLEAARNKFHQLIERRKGSRIALLAYAGSAHLVLPPTDDPALLDSFLQVLGSDMIPRPGKNALAAIEQAKRLLAAEHTPGTLVLATDGADASQLDAVEQALKGSDLQVLVLAVGNQDGGMLRDAHGQPRLDASGKPVLGRFDGDGLKQLADAADAPLGSLTLNDDDLDWIELHAQRHFQAAQGDDEEIHWKDAGYWLCWPLLALAFLAVRRGWSVNWLAALLLGLFLQAMPAQEANAGALADAFLTRDQQGRWAFEQGRYPQAAELFDDPYWKGRAAYQASDYQAALAAFARLDSAESWFYLGNTYMHLSKFADAAAAYRQALQRQPGMAEAQANLELALALEKIADEQREVTPGDEPDKIEFDKQKGKGKDVVMDKQKATSEDIWLQNLSTSPAQFLKRKFMLQDAREARP
ncbi:VWA domain-containing protein [Pseudomonas schmalbachii]|uniref:VWA domain-containing protein n=1 Tax=Pseudomonas schmalbachii TaxID=2816993 RepID=A0ABS3TWD4_9PSED|nr:VWA domain-containing protein [Pseudomonas schmalbachii]MBO3277953.1 VWA domain-containing protein [Pseudomonas schmalbachii]